jgi:hypothetical protein
VEPHGISSSISGIDLRRPASHVVWTDGSPSGTEELPAAGPSDLLRDPVARCERRVEPIEARRHAATGRRLAPRLDLLLDAPEPLAETLDEIDRVVLASVMAPTVVIVLRMPSIEVGSSETTVMSASIAGRPR